MRAPFAQSLLALVAGAMLAGGAVAQDEAATALSARLDALEPEIGHAEDVSAIKRLMRTYGFYLDRGLWEDLIGLMTDDAVGNYPAGVFVGRESLHAHFLMNNGRGAVGFEEGRLGNHIPVQPVITMHGDGTAEGRWHVLAQLGQYGESAFWAGGVYEVDYRKEDGVWKIARLDYYDTFSAPADVGWGAPPSETPSGERFADLPHPPDAPRDRESCPAFPGACIPPIHYANPGTGAPFVDPREGAE